METLMNERPTGVDGKTKRSSAIESRQQILAEASAMAGDDTRWHRRRKYEFVCWDEMRLHFGPGLTLGAICCQLLFPLPI